MDRDCDGRLPADKSCRVRGTDSSAGPGCLPSLGCAGVLALSGGIPGAKKTVICADYLFHARMKSRKLSLLLEDFGAFKDLLFDRSKRRFPRLTESERQQLRSKEPLEILLAQNPSRPSWMSDDDALLRVVDGWEHSLLNSKVVWAVVVQANRQLWSHGTEDYPAMVAWSPDDEFESDPATLNAVVAKIQTVREGSSDKDGLEELCQFLKNDLRRESFQVVPKSLTNGRNVVLSSILVFRNHLPQGYLAKSTLPLCVGEQWDFPVILPSAAWTKKLIDWWNTEDKSQLFRSRISMVGGRGNREASLPPMLRHHLTASLLLHPWILTIPGILLAFGAIGLHHFSHRDPISELAKIVMIGSGFAFLCGFIWLLAYVLTLYKSWFWHQDLIDLYEEIWKIGGVPWTRFYLMPHPSYGLHSYALVIKVVGHWFAFVPSGNGHFLATVSEATTDGTDGKGPVRLHRSIKIPSNAPERNRTVSDLKAQFREFGESLRAGRVTENDGMESR